MSRQFLREARLKIAGRLFTTRIAFEIKKGEQGDEATTSGATSNKSTVSVWNLSEDSRGMIEREAGKGTMVLEAGYKDALATLFVGDIEKVEMRRVGPDIETRIEAGDGERQLVEAHVEISLGTGATDFQIMDAAMKNLSLSRTFSGKLENYLAGAVAAPRQNGFAYSGTVADLIDQIVRKNGWVWSVQGGAIQIREKGDTSGRVAVLLTDQTGLIGIPNKTENGFKAEALLNPDLEPGRLVRIQSALLDGEVTYMVKGVDHVGDTHGEKWQTTVWGGQG